MRPIGYRLNVEVSGIEEFKEACKEVLKKPKNYKKQSISLVLLKLN